ncbi:protein Mis18-beta [Hypomesus transpacificus]|uniref:protein Mis18-beta n=1 Tax=Hypomesus transpacificus TaxID=137520 RepID=UPI001F077457|nr:protein Mis18-beta [Hypomesus transpacificus]
MDPREGVYRNFMTFHCGQCNTVWADSLGLCGEAKCCDSLICSTVNLSIEVTLDVIIKKEIQSSLEEKWENCIYNSLSCSGCGCSVGVVLVSAPQHLASLRSLFLIRKENTNCYQFSDGSMVKASTLNLDIEAIGTSIATLKQEMEAALEHISLLHGSLRESSTASLD